MAKAKIDPVTPQIIDVNANQPVIHEMSGRQPSLASSAAQWYCPPLEGHMLQDYGQHGMHFLRRFGRGELPRQFS